AFALFAVIGWRQRLVTVARFGIAAFTSSQYASSPFNDPTLWSLAVPFASGSLLMTMLADRRTAICTGLFSALIGGFLAPKGLEFIIYATIASSVAVYGIGHYRNRQTITIAGILIGLTSAGLAVALLLFTQQPFILNTVLLSVAAGLAGGIITAAVVAVMMP